jgi:hypothetical protein
MNLIGDVSKKNHFTPRYDGKYSVTQIISSLFPGQYSKIPIHYLVKASERGKKVHEMVHLYDLGQSINKTYKDYYNYLDAYLEFRESYKYSLKYSELTLVDHKLNIAGTLDKIFEKPNNVVGVNSLDLVDLKTRKVFYLLDVFQVNAYALMYRNIYNHPVAQRHILSLVKNANGKVKYKFTDVYNKYAEQIFKLVCGSDVLNVNFKIPREVEIMKKQYIDSIGGIL